MGLLWWLATTAVLPCITSCAVVSAIGDDATAGLQVVGHTTRKMLALNIRFGAPDVRPPTTGVSDVVLQLLINMRTTVCQQQRLSLNFHWQVLH
jgi:hypothetical protein